MSSANRKLLISADAHVAENENLRARLPEHLRERMPLMVLGDGGDFDVETKGEVTDLYGFDLDYLATAHGEITVLAS